MPLKSMKQNAWAHTPTGTKALGGKKKVKEWEQETDYSNLPERVSNRPGSRMRRTTRPR